MKTTPDSAAPRTPKVELVTAKALQEDKRAKAAKEKVRVAKLRVKAAKKEFKAAKSELKELKKAAKKILREAKHARRALQKCLAKMAKQNTKSRTSGGAEAAATNAAEAKGNLKLTSTVSQNKKNRAPKVAGAPSGQSNARQVDGTLPDSGE